MVLIDCVVCVALVMWCAAAIVHRLQHWGDRVRNSKSIRVSLKYATRAGWKLWFMFDFSHNLVPLVSVQVVWLARRRLHPRAACRPLAPWLQMHLQAQARHPPAWVTGGHLLTRRCDGCLYIAA
jgi:hypothetical protein